MNCRNNILIKSIAIVTAVVFMVNTAALAVPVQKPLDIRYQPSANIFIPEQYGRIEKSVNSKSPQVVLIKDAHCVYEAQKNISRILDILIRDYNIDLVCVEGAVDKVDTSRFGSYADTEAREKVAEKYLKNGLFTAGEALSIKNGANPGFTIYGVEDAKLYWKDFQAFRDTVAGARINNRFLELMDSIVFQLKKKLYPRRLLGFDNKANEYKNGKLSLTDWVKILGKEYGVRSKNGFKNFRLVVRAIVLEEKIDFKKVEIESAVLIRRLEKGLVREDLKGLVKNSLLFRLGKISALDYYTYLEGIGNAQMGENLRRYVKLVKVQARIDEDGLFRELALTEEGIYKNLIPDEITGKIHQMDKDLNILKNILQLKANRKEVLYYKENRANFTLDRFLDFIKIQAPLNGVPLPKEFNTPSFLEEVKKSISPSEEFYELALKRDEALVDNLLKRMGNANPVPMSHRGGAKKDKAILVCGGFHAEGIGNLLRAKGINLVTISPSITKAEEDSQNLYLSRMMDERIKPVDILSQLGLGNIQPVAPHDTALPKTVGDLLLAGPEIDIQKFCKRAGVGEEELPKLTIKDLDRGLLRGLEEEYVTTDDDAYAGFLELVFSEYNKTGTKEQIDSTALRGKRENIQEIKSELIANFLMESLGGEGRLILLTLAKHSFGAGDISPERLMEELYSGGVEAVNRCLGVDIEEVVFSIIKTWQEAENARREGRTDNEAYREMGEFLGIIDENIGYVWHEKAPQFFAHLERLSRVIENVNNFLETMLRAYRMKVYLNISDEIEPNILDNIDFILSVINEIPEEIRARYKPYLYIYLHKEMDSIGGSNVYHEKGGINLKMVDAIRNNQERRKVLATIVVHEFFHKLVMGINAEGTDLIFPIRDWIDFLLLNGIGTVITEGGEVSIEEYLDLDRYGLKEVKRRLYRLSSGNIRYSHTPTRDVEGEYYKKEIADPHELLAHMIASEIFGQNNFVYYEGSFRVFDRHMLASFSPGKSYRYDREGMKWKTIGSDRGNKGDSVYIGREDGDVQGCLAARLKNEKTGGRRFSLGKSVDRVNISVSFKNVSFKILVDVGELGISEQDFLDILKRVLNREDLSNEDLAKLQGRELTFATVSGYKSLGGDCKQNGIVLIHKVWREIYSANREVGLSLLEMILSHEIIFHEINGSPGDFESEMARVQQDARDFFSAYLYYTRGQKLDNDDLRKIDDILSNYLQVSAVALFGLGRRSINSGDVKIFRKIYVSRRSLWSKTGLHIFEGVEFIVGVFSGEAKAFLRSVRLSLAILFGNIVICGLVILIALSLFLHRPPDVIPPAETPIKQGEVFIPAQGVEKDITRKVMPGKSEEKKITLLELPKKSAYTCEFNPAPNELDGYMDEVVPIIKKHMNGWRYDRVWDVEEGKWVWGKDDKWDGYSPEVLKALVLSIFYAESSDSHFKKIVDKPVKGSEWRYVRLKDSNGKYVWVELNVSSANEIGIAQIIPQTMEDGFIGGLTEDIFRIVVNTRDGGENWTSTTTARIRVGLINDLVFGGKLPIEEWEKFVGDEYTHKENSEKFKKKLRGKIEKKFSDFIKKCKEDWRFNLSVGACYFTLNIIEGYFSDEHLEDPLYPFLTQALYYYAVGGARQIKKDNPGTWVSKVYRENGDIPTYVNNISESFRRFTGLPIYVLRPAWRFTDGIDQSYIIEDDFLARAIRFIAWGVPDTGDIPSWKILREHLKVQIQRGGKPEKKQVKPKVKKRAGTHKAIGPTWSDEDNAVFEEQCKEILSGIGEETAPAVMDKIRDASVLANKMTNASGEDAVKADRIAIHIVPLPTLGIPRRPGATSASEMVYAVGRDGYYDSDGNLVNDGRLHIYVTRRYWDEYLSNVNAPSLQVLSPVGRGEGEGYYHLAETLDHEWQENVLGKTHRQAAGMARFFVKKGQDLSEYHIFVIEQILSEGFSGLLYLAGILAEERKGNYEEKFRRYIEEKIKSANPSCAILGPGDSAFYECIEGSPIIMIRAGDENRIKIEKEPMGKYTVIFTDKNGNRVGDVSFLDSGRELIINGYVLYMKGDTIKITNIKDKNSYVVTETTVISEELFNEGVITPSLGYTGEVYNDKGIPSWGELLREVKKEGLVRSAIDKIKGQSGRAGNFVDIKGVSRLIVVGDLHGNYKNLMDILSRDNIWDDLKAGKAHLVILGDAIHPGSGDLACDAAQEDSTRMLLLLMKLIADLPQGSVTYILGDHELSHLDERYGVKKGDVDGKYVYQNKVFEKYIIRQYGEEFLNIIKNFLKTLPYAVRINGEIVLTHAGASENLISEEHLKMLDAVDVDILSRDLLRDIMFRVEEERKVKEREINWFLRTLNCSLLVTGHTIPTRSQADMYNFSVVKEGTIGCAYGKQLIVDSQTDSPGYIDMDMKKSDTRKGLVDLVDRGGKPALKVLGIDIVEEVVDEILGIFNKYGLKIERKDVWEAVVRARGEVGAPPLERLFSLLRDIPQLDLKGLFALTKEISGPLNKIIPDFDKKRGGEIVANVLTEILGEIEVKGKVIAEGENIREKFFNTVKRLLVSYGVTEAELAGELELVELGLFLLEYEPLLKITKVDKAYLDYLALVCELAGVEPDTLRGIFSNAYMVYQNKETVDKLGKIDVGLELALKRKGLWSRFKRAEEICDMIKNSFSGAEVCSGDTILGKVVRRLRLYKTIVDNKINTVSGLSEDMAGLDFKGVSTQRPQELVTYLSGTSVAVEGGGRLIDALGVNVNKQITVSIPEELFIEEIKGNRITYSPGIWAVLRRLPNLTVEIRTEEIAKIQPIIDLLIREHPELDGRVIIKGEIIEKDRTNTVYVLGEVDKSLADAIKNNRINAFFTNSMALYSVLIYGALQASVKTMFENGVYTPEAKDVIRKLEIFGVSKETIDKILNENQPLIIITTEQLLRQYQLYRATIEIAA